MQRNQNNINNIWIWFSITMDSNSILWFDVFVDRYIQKLSHECLNIQVIFFDMKQVSIK